VNEKNGEQKPARRRILNLVFAIIRAAAPVRRAYRHRTNSRPALREKLKDMRREAAEKILGETL